MNRLRENRLACGGKRKKAFLGAIIGGVIAIGSAVAGSISKKKAAKKQAREEEEAERKQKALDENLALTEKYANNAELQNEYEKRFQKEFACGGSKRVKKAVGGVEPIITEGGAAVEVKPRTFLLRGRAHKTGGIVIGKGSNSIEAENGEVVENTKNDLKIYSAQPIINGESPANLVLKGVDKNKVFKAQEEYKKKNKLKDDGTKKMELGGDKPVTKPTNKNEFIDKWNNDRLATGRYNNQLGDGKAERQMESRNTAKEYKSPIAFSMNYGRRATIKTPSTTEDEYRRQVAYNAKAMKDRLDKTETGTGKIGGAYHRPTHSSYINQEELAKDPTIRTHENAHASRAIEQENVVSDIINTNDDSYYTRRPTEVYSRLMQFREANEINPNTIFDKKSLKDLKKNAKDYNLFDTFKDDEVMDLLNNVASNSGNNDKRIKAKYGCRRKMRLGGMAAMESKNSKNMRLSQSQTVSNGFSEPSNRLDSKMNKTSQGSLKQEITNPPVKGIPRFACGGKRKKASLGMSLTTGDWISAGASAAGSIISGVSNLSAANKMKAPERPNLVSAGKLKTDYNINPQLAANESSRQRMIRGIDRDTASSVAAIGRRNRINVDSQQSDNILYGQKENIETQLMNQDALNRQEVSARNVDKLNEHTDKVANFNNQKTAMRTNAINNMVSGIAGAGTDLIAQGQQRYNENQQISSIIGSNEKNNLKYMMDAGWKPDRAQLEAAISSATDDKSRAFYEEALDKLYGRNIFGRKNKLSTTKAN